MCLLHCISPLLARNRPSAPPPEGPLTEVLRTFAAICRSRTDAPTSLPPYVLGSLPALALSPNFKIARALRVPS
jgi:hypothetical protein